MSKFPNLFLISLILKLFKCQIYCGIGQINYNVSFPSKKQPKNSDGNYRPIQIYLESSTLKDYIASSYKLNNTIFALNYVIKILQKLIKVKPLNYTISINQNDLNNWGFSKYDQNILNGIDTDLIILIKYIDTPEKYYMSSEPKYIDEYTKRPIVGIIYIYDRFISDIYTQNNCLYYTEILLLHQFTHILGFLYQTFQNFPGGINNVILTINSDERSNIKRNYIKTPKVLEFAKKYYKCENINGIELEDQDGPTNSHWEARTLLGEYMNSEQYLLEQVISEFTLALLEDSGWYIVNYYTGGLMRFGKNKGCEFINMDCINIENILFKNEFFNKDEEKYGCSSGRQSRGYRLSKAVSEGDIENYVRFGKKGYFEIADLCLVYYQNSEEENRNGMYVGNCNRGNGGYGTTITYYNNIPHSNLNLPKELGEKYDFNSFCVLSSVSIKNTNEFYKFNKNVIHPMCYPMICSENSLTIQIYNQFVVCPRSGGKVQVNGNYEGYLFCPDYNLICTGTVICNDMFDCVEKESLIKNNTFIYDYDIKTNQIINELIDAEIETIVYELSDDGPCPKDCEQCNNLKQCIMCREGFYYIGVKEDEIGPIICLNLSDISKGYYEIKDENNKAIYYPCSRNCDKCNKTHCFKCNNFHKLDENNTFCIEKVKNCEIYENITYTCIKCKEEYTFIGLDRNICHIINKTKYYTNDNGISYYLCNTSIPNCDECNNSLTCERCISPYYFLENNRNACFNDKNLSKYFTEDNGISYIPCDINFFYCDECTSRFNCLRCINNYYLVNENGYISCKNINPKKYYKEGIFYYSCLNAINNCDECDEKNKCNKCINNYYFLKDNRTFCRNDINIANKYYTNDNGISYYPCDTNIENCNECKNETTCIKCANSYGFFINNYNECIFVGNNKYFSLDGGITFDFCSSIFPNCDECENNEYCTKCKENFYFFDDDKSKCLNDKNLSKYYFDDKEKTYILCNNSIPFCENCFNNKSKCVECKKNKGYYFFENDRTKCINNLNLSKYYTEDDGISYYPCNEALKFCDICNEKEECIKCINNYFFIGNDRKNCYNEINFKKYYSNDNAISFFPCNTSISHCDECFNENFCHICELSYILLNENPTECFQESLYINNDEYFKLNNTHYKKCSLSIEHCYKCNLYNYCIKCENNYFFLNDDHTKCILEENILPKDEFFKFNEDNYYSCNNEKGIKNCQKCINNIICQKCEEEYALIYNFFNICISKEELKIGYYYNEEKTIYYPCFEHCDACFNSFECEKCSENYILLNEKTLCENCEVKIEKIENSFDKNLINVFNYINMKKNALALHYINSDSNYSITFFKAWECTEELWKKNYLKFNTSSLNNLINKKFNIEKKNLVYAFISKNYKNNLEIFNSSNGQKINIENDCPECIEIGYEIINNYSNNLQKEIGTVLLNKIKENNIDIFNKGDKYISNICQNFTISKIDLSIKDRINYLYIGDYTNEVICTDKICIVESYKISDFSGICKCKINSDFDYLTSTNIKILNSNNNSIPYEISFSIFKCFKNGFNISILSNTGFYLFSIFIILQILCFIFFLCFEKKNINLSPQKKNVDASNPPKKELENEILFIENFDIIENSNNNIITLESEEKQIQEKDDGEIIEDIKSYYEFDNSTYNNKDKESIMTDIKGEIGTLNKKKNSYSIKEEIQKQETYNSIFEKEEEKEVKNKKKLFKEKKCVKINRGDISLKYKDILSLNIMKKTSKKSENIYANTDGNERNNKIGFKKKKNLKNKRFSEASAISNEKLINIKDKISSIKKSIIASPDNLSFEKAKSKDNLSFCEFYWYLLGLKQPLLNLASQIKMFKITESFVPSGIKLIRFIFMLGLNFFINSLFLSQKYFSEKFKYFDDKYNLRISNLGMDISTNERFSYAFKHTILFSVFTFIICYIIQGIINYFYFNLRKRINLIIENDSEVEEEIKDYFDSVRIKYKFIFMINIILMILFWYYIINFTAVYRGGDLDYIASAILTFAFLQIFPFFICLFLAIFRYCGLKKSEEKIYKFSQIFAY